MPSPELPEAFLPLRPFTTAGGGCATLSVQESFWFAQPSRQGWSRLLLDFMMDRAFINGCFFVNPSKSPVRRSLLSHRSSLRRDAFLSRINKAWEWGCD